MLNNYFINYCSQLSENQSKLTSITVINTRRNVYLQIYISYKLEYTRIRIRVELDD